MLPELHQVHDVFTLGIQYDELGKPWWAYSDGTMLPVIAGGADDGDADDSDSDDSDADDGAADDSASDDDGDADDSDSDDDKPLGPKGEKALAAEKAKRRKESERRRAAEARARELEQQLEKKKDDSDAPDPDAIREEARREAQRETLRERTLDRIEARAGKKFADPEDARAILAGRAEDFIDGDEIDNDAIAEALDELLEKKPHLAKGRRKFDGGADGGAKKDKKKPAGSLEEAIQRQYAGKT